MSEQDASGPSEKGEKEKFPRRPMLSVKPIGNLLIQDPKVAVVSPSVKPQETVTVSSSGGDFVEPTSGVASSSIPSTATAPPPAAATPTIHIANQQNIILNQQNLGEFLAQNSMPGSPFFIQGSDSQLPIITNVRGSVTNPLDPSLVDSLDPLSVQPPNQNQPPSATESLQEAVVGDVGAYLSKGHVINYAVNLTIINLASNIPSRSIAQPQKQYTNNFIHLLIKKAGGKEVYCIDLENIQHRNAESLGLRVKTEVNHDNGEVTMLIYNISSGSWAERDGRLAVNDRILSIDGKLMNSQSDVFVGSTMLAQKRKTISLLINRARYLDQRLLADFKQIQSANSNTIRGNSVITNEAYDQMKIVSIQNNNDKNLGIDFTEVQDGEGGIVKQCKEGGVAFEAGVLQPGDVVHFIMGSQYRDATNQLSTYVDLRNKADINLRFNLANLLKFSQKVRLYITPRGMNKLTGPHVPHDTQVVTIPWQPNQAPARTYMPAQPSMLARTSMPPKITSEVNKYIEKCNSGLARTTMPARTTMHASLQQGPRADEGISQLSVNPPLPAIGNPGSQWLSQPSFYPVTLVDQDGSIRVHSTAGLYKEVVSGQISPSRTVDIVAEQVDLCNDRKGLGLELIRTDGLYIQKIRLASIAGQDERLRQGDCILYISFVSGVDKKFINLSSEFDHQLTRTLNDVSESAVSFRLIVCRKIRHTLKISSPFVDTSIILKLEELERRFDQAASATGKTQLRVINKISTPGNQKHPNRKPSSSPLGLNDIGPERLKCQKWQERLGPNYQVICASFNKRECPSKGLGVGLENRVEVDFKGNSVSCHYINKVVPTGAVACNGNIKANDHLLQANEHILYNKTFSEVKDILKTLPASVDMFSARKVSVTKPSMPIINPTEARVKPKEIPLISLDGDEENETAVKPLKTPASNQCKKRQVKVIISHNTEIKPWHIQNVRITLEGMEKNTSFYGHIKAGKKTGHLPIQVLTKRMYYTNHNLAKVVRGCVEVFNRSDQSIKLNSGISLGNVCEENPSHSQTNYNETSLLITLKESFEGLEIPSGQTRDVSGFVHGLDDNLVSQLDNITTQFKINPIPSESVMPYKVEACTSRFFLLPKNEKSMVSVRFKMRNTSTQRITFSNPIGQPNIIAIAEILDEDCITDLDTQDMPDLETVTEIPAGYNSPQNDDLLEREHEKDTDSKSGTSVVDSQSLPSVSSVAVDLKDLELFCPVSTSEAISIGPNQVKAIQCPISMTEDEITAVFGETESREGLIVLQDNVLGVLKMFSSLERIDKLDAVAGKAMIELLVYNPEWPDTILLEKQTKVGSLYFKKYLPSQNSSFMKIVLRHDLSITSGNTSTVMGFIEESTASKKICETSLIMISTLSTEKLPYRTSSGCAKVNKCDVKCSTTGKTYSWCVSLKLSYILKGKSMLLSTSPLGLPIAKAELICQSIIGKSSEKCLELMAFNTLLPPFSITNITCKLTGVPELLSSYQIKAKLRKHKTKICLFSPHLTATLADELLGQRNFKNPNRSQKVKVPLYNFTDRGVHISNDEPLASFSYVNVLNNTSSTSTPTASLPSGYAFLHKDGQHFPVVTKTKLTCSSEYWEDFRPILVTVPPSTRENLYGNTGLVTFVSAQETVAPFFVKPQLVSFDEKNKGEEMSFHIKVQLKSHSVNTEVKKNIVPRATFANKHLSISADVLVAQLYLVTKIDAKPPDSRVSSKAGLAWKRRGKPEPGDTRAKKKKIFKRETSLDDLSHAKQPNAPIVKASTSFDGDTEEIKLEDIKLFVDLNQQNRTKLLTEKQKEAMEHTILPKHKKPHIVTLENLTECSVYLPDILYLGETKKERDVVVSHSLHYYSRVVSSRAQTKLSCKRCPFRTGDSVDLLSHLRDYHFSEDPPQEEKKDSNHSNHSSEAEGDTDEWDDSEHSDHSYHPSDEELE